MKQCPYHPQILCFRTSCDAFSCDSGDVLVCRLHGNPSGRLMKRKGGDVFG